MKEYLISQLLNYILEVLVKAIKDLENWNHTYKPQSKQAEVCLADSQTFPSQLWNQCICTEKKNCSMSKTGKWHKVHKSMRRKCISLSSNKCKIKLGSLFAIKSGK